MASRVTRKMLEDMVKNLNRMTDRPETPDPGHLSLDQDMTGYQLTEKMESGGEKTIIPRCSAKEMWHAIVGIGEGVKLAKK